MLPDKRLGKRDVVRAGKDVLASAIEQIFDAVGAPNKFMVRQVAKRFATAGDQEIIENLFPDEVTFDLQERAEDVDSRPTLFARLLVELGRSRVRPLTKRIRGVWGAEQFLMDLDMLRHPECAYYLRDPTPALTRLLLRSRGGTMIDVGANAGYHTLTASLLFEHVLAFEPTSETAQRLQKNVTLSERENVTVCPFALSDHEGTEAFYTSEHLTGGNSLSPDFVSGGPVQEQSVQTRRLDDFLKERDVEDVTLIKLDVEGHEREALRGGRETLRTHRPLLFVEMTQQNNEDILEEVGAAYRVFDPKKQAEIDRDRFRAGEGKVRNAVFCVHDPYAESAPGVGAGATV